MSSDLAPAPSAKSALRSYLDRAVIHEEAGAPLSPTIVGFGLLGAAVTLIVGLVGLATGDAQALHHSGFLLIFRGPAAGLGGTLHALAVPLIVIGAIVLVLDLWLLSDRKPRASAWRPAIVGQTICGSASGLVGSLFVVIFVINLVIWIVIAIVTLMILIGMLAALADG